ncbi:SDR family oxidoreductase [Paludibacterium yongneupense]|nr:SDR family oxidoreductase [Paludibacterium yongneupense]
MMPTLLIVGCGDVARRALPALSRHWRILALVRKEAEAADLRTRGVLPLRGDLDCRASLVRLAGLADALLYTAPPNGHGERDTRLRRLLSALAKAKSIPQRLIYISTSGVYGDAHGRLIDESCIARPASARAVRRLDAEHSLRAFAIRHGVSLTILRAPGIYAIDRLPLDAVAARRGLIVAAQDSYSNHIHADDLARLCVHALRRRGAIRIFNACDNEPMAVGDWYDLLADACGVERAPRFSRAELQGRVSALQWSFLSESRRLDNSRLHRELGMRLDWPSVRDFIAAEGGRLAKAIKIR